jgi:predicted amidohydrolase YtcJ
LAALVYQLGLPAFISGHELYKSIPNLFLPLQCYKSVRTLSSQLSHADCFTVYNGKFSSVFVDDLTADAVKETRVGYVYPGLWDGHGHLIQFGESLDSVSLFGADSMDEIKRRLVEYKAGRSEKGTSEQWLRGVGWDQAHFDGKWPTSVRYLITVWRSERLMLCIVRPRDK